MKITSSFAILIILAIALPACANGLNVWLYGDTQNLSNQTERFLGARLGYRFGDQEKYEAGLAVQWWPNDKVNVPQAYAAYVLARLSDPIPIDNPFPFAGLPAKLMAEIYGGGQVGFDFYHNGVFSGPCLDVVIEKIINIRYEYQIASEALGQFVKDGQKLTFGLKIEIP